MKNITFKILLAVGCFGIAAMAPAQTRVPIDVTINAPGKTPPTWVSLSGFTGEAESLLRFDLYVQGFNFTNADNAQYQIAGSNNGNLQGRVTDRIQKSTPLNKGYSGGNIVQQVHLFVDEFVKLTGRDPI